MGSELGSVGAELWEAGGDHLLFLLSGHDSPFDGNPGTPNPTAGVWVSRRTLHGFQPKYGQQIPWPHNKQRLALKLTRGADSSVTF